MQPKTKERRNEVNEDIGFPGEYPQSRCEFPHVCNNLLSFSLPSNPFAALVTMCPREDYALQI